MTSNGNGHGTNGFTHEPAVCKDLPLLVGLYGASGSGKTLSAIRVAEGMRRVYGGKVFVIDTESGRAKHYAPRSGERATPGQTYEFEHVQFNAPYGALRYTAALEYCVANGASVIVVDSASHEHEGPGGLLEQHAEEHKRLGGKETTKMLAWSKPKAARRKLIDTLVHLRTANGLPCPTVWCWRAKEKLEMRKGEEPLKLGWMPIGGEEFFFEMTVRALLEPGCDGVPSWAPTLPGEKEMVRVPRQFRELLNARDARPLCEDDGEAMARWAINGSTSASVEPRPASVPPPADTPRFWWKANREWNDKPLADAPLSVLRAYAETVNAGLDKAPNERARGKIQTLLDAANEAVEQAEAEAALDDAQGEASQEAAV